MALDFKLIEIGDKEKLSGYLKNNTYLGWDYCFDMLYIWNVFGEMRVATNDFAAFVYTKFFGKCVYYPPYTDTMENQIRAIDVIRNESLTRGCLMRVVGISKEVAERLDPEIYDIETDRDNSDYIYNASDLINLSGKKFHSKRNFVSRFKRLYSYEFREYTDADRDAVFGLYDDWHDHAGHETLELERKVITRALDNYKELGLKIGVITIDGKLAAFSISSVENDLVAHAMIEKGDTKYEGIYQIINQQTAENFFQGVQYVNREEDMGIEGLRKAKLSYNPVLLLDKYTVRLKSQRKENEKEKEKE